MSLGTPTGVPDIDAEKPGRPADSRVVHFFKNLGPGLITGAADDDPSGISTYSVAGATTGLSTIWLALVTTPMMAVVQGMCARIGMVSGAGLAAMIRGFFPRWLAVALAILVIGANTANIGADLAGMAAAMHLLIGLPIGGWVAFFGVALIVSEIFLPYRILTRMFKWLTLALFAYVITAFVVHPDWWVILRHLVIPEFHRDGHWITTVVAVLGTTISPYLFFWQSAMMVEQEKAMGRTTTQQRRGATRTEIIDAHSDVNTGMIYSNAVMFFIITTTAVTLGAHGKHDIATAQDAAEALQPLAGKFASLLFTIGMVATGLLAVPVLAGSSAYVAAEMLQFRSGLAEVPARAPRFYAVLALGIAAGIVMNFLKIDPIAALFWSAVLNGVAAVPLVLAVVLIARNRRVMGEWTSSLLAQCWGWATLALMTAAAIGMFVFWNQQ